MPTSFSRRSFMRTGFFASVASAGAGSAAALDLLRSPDGFERVSSLVVETLKLPLHCAPQVRRFLAALRDGTVPQTDEPERLQALHRVSGASAEELAAYVAQELVATSNYYEFTAGQADALVLLEG